MDERDLNEIIATENKNKLMALGIAALGLVFMLFHPILGIPFIIAGAVLFFLSQSRLSKIVGRAVALKVLSRHIEDLSFDQEGGFSDELIDSVYMGFPAYDSIKCGDHIKGRYKGRDLELCDLELTETRVVKSGKTTRTEHVTVFQGPYVCITYDKEINDPVTVTENGSFFNRGNLVKTESEEFNRRFKIYCSSEHDAFYIITPHMMERIEEIYERAEHEIFLNFCNDGHIYMAVDNRHDSFELSLMDKEAGSIEDRFEKELQYLLSLIDELSEGFR